MWQSTASAECTVIRWQCCVCSRRCVALQGSPYEQQDCWYADRGKRCAYAQAAPSQATPHGYSGGLHADAACNLLLLKDSTRLPVQNVAVPARTLEICLPIWQLVGHSRLTVRVQANSTCL